MCHRKLFHLTLWSTVLPFLFLLLCSVLIDEAIAENGAGSCGEALARCETSESCKWHIGDVRVRCAMTGNCVREKCAEVRDLDEALSLQIGSFNDCLLNCVTGNALTLPNRDIRDFRTGTHTSEQGYKRKLGSILPGGLAFVRVFL